MTVMNILRYWTTDDAQVLNAFLAQANERYAALEDGYTPIKEAVQDLDRDWSVRPTEYWMALIQQCVVLRDVTKACVLLFERVQSSERTPVPLVVVASAPNYSYALYNALDMLGRAGIALTSYSVVCHSSERKHLRQRQDVLHALCDVDGAVHEAIREGRAELEQAPMLHTRLTSSEALTTVRERYISLRTRQEVL